MRSKTDQIAGECAERALADGFTRAELRNVARAVLFLRAANPGMTEAEAYTEVSTPYTKANRLLQYGDDADAVVFGTMYMTGCTLSEAIASYERSRPIPFLPDLAGYSYELQKHRTGAAESMASDLARGVNYGRLVNGADNGDVILNAADVQNKLTFPDGETVAVIPGPNGKPAADRAVEKTKALCSKVHVAQANTVAWYLTQSSKTSLRGALNSYGINSNEHVVLDIALAKDAETGAVTIRYSSPKALPVQFSWTTTIAVDGTSTSTPMVIEQPQ